VKQKQWHPFGRAKRMWSALTNIEKYITTSKRMWPVIQWCNHMNACDVITLMYMMYIMMYMYLYNIIYTILEIYGTVWTWIYRFRTSSVSCIGFCHRWKLSCQGKGSHKDCCSAGPTWVLVDLKPRFMQWSLDWTTTMMFFFGYFFCISGMV